MARFRATIPAVLVAVIVLVATPVALAVKNSSHPDSSQDEDLVTVQGKVTALLYGDDWEDEYDDDEANDTDDNDDENEIDDDDENETDEDEMNEGREKNKTHEPRLTAFVLDNDTIVTFGPWWYWAVQNVTVADVVHLNDTVNVTGEVEEEDGRTILSAWSIHNQTTGDELTIRGEGRPPWAGGPKALIIDPWPSTQKDE